MKYPKELPIEKHIELGKQLKAFNHAVCHMAVLLANTYGSTSQIGKKAFQLSQNIQDLKNLMENQMFGEGSPDANTRVYYGQPEKVEEQV